MGNEKVESKEIVDEELWDIAGGVDLLNEDSNRSIEALLEAVEPEQLDEPQLGARPKTGPVEKRKPNQKHPFK